MENLYDLIIIGAGPAGLSAGIYMARAKYKTLILEKEKIGGQITITEEVVNYPSVLKTSGEELTKQMAKQAEAFGAEIKIDEVVSLNLENDIKEVITKTKTYRALTIIIATGANPRKLGFKGESEYQGRGVAYCATCDGEFFTNKDIFVVGGGFAAAEEAMFLTRFGKSVSMIIREPEMTCASSIIDKVKNHEPKINLHYFTEVKEISGDDFPRRIEFINNQTNETWSYENKEDTFGTFVFAGYVPNTNLIKGKVELDKFGYVITDENKQTNVSGVFAAGDLCVKNLRQVVTATSDGAIAATSCEKIASELHKKLNIPSLFVENKKVENKFENSKDGQFISAEMLPQLKGLFDQLLDVVTVEAHLNTSQVADELNTFVSELENISSNLKVEKIKDLNSNDIPYITLKNTKEYANYKFFGVPGGHEFTSFVVTIHRLFAQKKELSEVNIEKLNTLKSKVKLDVVISLSCTKCPNLVMAFAHILSYNQNIELNIYDIAYSTKLRDEYKIMSVPCTIINDKDVVFGQKDVDEIIDILTK